MITVGKGIRGVHIRRARKLLRWTQGELARRAGLSPGTIHRMESSPGQARGLYYNLRRVAECFQRYGIDLEGTNGG